MLSISRLYGAGSCRQRLSGICSKLVNQLSAQVVETSVKVTSNSPSQDYTHPDDHNLPTYDMTPGFKPFTILNYNTS